MSRCGLDWQITITFLRHYSTIDKAVKRTNPGELSAFTCQRPGNLLPGIHQLHPCVIIRGEACRWLETLDPSLVVSSGLVIQGSRQYKQIEK